MPATSDPAAGVVVVGAGIVGASVGYQLACAGADVALLDRSLPASGATGDSFAWIGRGTSDAPPEQVLLRRQVLKDYRRLERELTGVRVRWTGSLIWSHDDPTAAGNGHTADLADGRLVDAGQVMRLEPHLQTVPASAELRAADGAVDPVAVTAALVAGARQHGARVRTGVTVHSLAVRDHHVVGVSTSAGFLPVRTVVLASGTDAPRLCAPLGIDLPVGSSPALLMHFSAPPRLVRTLVSNDQIELRETADGHLLVAWGYHGETTQQELDRAGQRMLAQLRTFFSGAGDAELISVRVGWRPMPADGSPIIGPIPAAPGGYLTVMHSGITLAATVGRLVASEIMADDLRPGPVIAGGKNLYSEAVPAGAHSPRPVGAGVVAHHLQSTGKAEHCLHRLEVHGQHRCSQRLDHGRHATSEGTRARRPSSLKTCPEPALPLPKYRTGRPVQRR